MELYCGYIEKVYPYFMLKVEKQHLPQSQQSIRLLYQKYGASLLGYLSQILPDQKKAEEYLIKILSHFASRYPNEIIQNRVNWLNLLQYTRSAFAEWGITGKGSENQNAPIASTNQQDLLITLSHPEKEVFCAIYYHGNSIGELARRMGKNEHAIRSQFKISLDKIRSTREN